MSIEMRKADRSQIRVEADAARPSEPRALALQFAVELAFGLAQFAGQALERFLLVDAGFGLQAGHAGGE